MVGNLEWALVQPGRSPIPKFDTMGITTNSLGRRANPVCLSFVSQECAVAYTAMYDAVEAVLYQILVNVKCCKRDKGCEVCDSILN